MDKFSQFTNLLNDAKKFKGVELSVFDVAGFPHYENVISNILAFFFTPDGRHGLRKCFLKALVDCLEHNSSILLSDVKVDREAYTGNGRLDLVIKTRTHLIGIENKIRAPLVNDLSDYSSYLDDLAIQNGIGSGNVLKVVLSIREEQVSDGFKNVTYQNFFEKLNLNDLNIANDDANKWILFAKDLVSSVEKEMNNFSAEDDFASEKEDEIRELINIYNNYKSKLNLKLKVLMEKMPLETESHFTQWIYQKSCLVHDFETGSHQIVFDLELSSSGWKLYVFGRDQESNNYVNSIFSKLEGIKQELHRNEIKWSLKDFKLEDSYKDIAGTLIKYFNTIPGLDIKLKAG